MIKNKERLKNKVKGIKKTKINKDKKINHTLINLILRYCMLIILGLSLPIFYFIFTKSTLFLLEKILSLSFNIRVIGNLVYGPKIIEIIPACIGGSAYYLLLILNLTTPKISIKKRSISIIFMFLLFFIFNLLRLIFLIYLEFNGINTYFYHKLLWYFGSTIFVFIILILNIKVFRIKEIPVISDINYVKQLSK